MTTIEMLEEFPPVILDTFDGCPHFFGLDKGYLKGKPIVSIGYFDEADNSLYTTMPLFYNTVDEAVKSMWETLKDFGIVCEENKK